MKTSISHSIFANYVALAFAAGVTASITAMVCNASLLMPV
jgi:hypothetical protein